ncbi:MAG: electron transfer flavoprotein subunit alpha/FixB family protein [Planctomycetota bacterium]|jgi:electron transfer flavoprotein alpha subunit
MAKILVFAEVRDGAIKRSGFEAIAEAKRLGAEVAAVLVGEGVRELAPATGNYGASRAFVVDQPALKLYCAEGYGQAVAGAVKKLGADAVFLSATAMGRDLGPSVAAFLGTGVAADCVGIRLDGSDLVFRRPVYAGKAFVEVKFTKAPVVASLRPNVFAAGDADASKSAEVEDLPVELQDGDLRSRVTDVAVAAKGKAELTEAATIVAGGRGMKAPENFQMIDDLALALGGAVGASRAVVDAGWRPHTEQVGQTGKTVSPGLYFAIGISGAIQHLAGMSSSGVVVAVNKDPEAPIFKKATYGIVGDLFEVVPKLVEELKKALQS